ncbi:Rap30/74 interaction domain-containing protein [Periconia macrospinosa]|uniref:Rap30/74 interaction domain-containing protein n=1 Tax=Periconia macrospinosa TaxID=97972 RepID=A0A2V1E9W8_9PLEO|nr:Rap30/74 interaction domain-containing protein [Periconia macrospinosa]
MNGAPNFVPPTGSTANAPTINGSTANNSIVHPSSSTSPATMTGNTPTARTGPPRRRKPRGADPLRAPRRPLKTIARPITSLTTMNQTSREHNAPSAMDVGPGKPNTAQDYRNELLSQGARSFPLVVSRKDLAGLRHHVMRLQSKDHINPQDDNQFTPPVRLHRRDPRAPPSGAGAQIVEEEDTKEDIEESKERERMEMQREERRKQREENQAKIAPTGVKKQPAFQKKTEQKYRPDDTPESRKRSALRYEETLPWHLEDFDNKQTWVGTYESTFSDAHVMLNAEGGQSIRMVPLEKWYRFQSKTKAKSTEDPELAKQKSSGYFLKLEQKVRIKQEDEQRAKAARGMRVRAGGGAADEGRIRRVATDDQRRPDADADDIDFNVEEDFADDEEGLNGLFEGEEADLKDTAEKVKRDQLAAAAFDLRDEQEVERQEKEEQETREQQRQLEKALRKSLVKREKNIDYEEEGDNPYESSSDSDTTDAEAENVKAEEAKKTAEQNGKPQESDKPASGASTKGANTPSGNHRPLDVRKKRPGSPNLSEASGNESSRKKQKKKHDKSTLGHASPTSSRAGSPVASRLPSAAEIHSALPPGGIKMKEFITRFRGRIDKANTPEFIKLVKVVAKYDKERGWLTPLPQLPKQE